MDEKMKKDLSKDPDFISGRERDSKHLDYNHLS
jgi:hypothetical protein